MGGEAPAVSEKEREMDDVSLCPVGSSKIYNAPDADPCANRSYMRIRCFNYSTAQSRLMWIL